MMTNLRERSQFRWLTIWLMPIPIVILVLLPVALLVTEWFDATWARVSLSTIAVAVYAVCSLLLRRALPSLERSTRLKDGKTSQS